MSRGGAQSGTRLRAQGVSRGGAQGVSRGGAQSGTRLSAQSRSRLPYGPSGAPSFDCLGLRSPVSSLGCGVMVRGLLEVQVPQRLGLAPIPQVTVSVPQTSHSSSTHHSASGAPTLWWRAWGPRPSPWAPFSTAGLMPVSCAHWPTDRPTDGTPTTDPWTAAACGLALPWEGEFGG